MSRVGIIFTGKYTYFITHTNLLPSFFIIMHKIPPYGDETRHGAERRLRHRATLTYLTFVNIRRRAFSKCK